MRKGRIDLPTRRRLGLRGKTVLITAIGFLSIFGFAGYEGVVTHETEVRRTLGERIFLAQSAARHLDEHLQEATERIDELVSALASVADRESAGKLLRTSPARRVFTGGLIWRDADGRVLLADPEVLRLASPDPTVQPQLVEARRTGKPALSGLLVSPVSGDPAIHVVAPMVDDVGRVGGFVEGKLDPTAVPVDWWLLSPVSFGKTGYSQVVDENGTVIAHSKPGRRFKRADHADLILKLIAQGKPVVGTYTHPGGGNSVPHEEVVAFAPITAVRWGVSVEQGRDEAFASVAQLRNRIFGIGGVALLATLILTWLITRRAVLPIVALRQATARMAEGNLDDPVPASGRDEVADLACDFERMRQSLKGSREEIERLYQKSQADNERLRKLDEMKTQLVATISHDYKNPLAVIGTLIELMLAHDCDESTRRQYLELIQSEVWRLSELVGDVLELSRVQSGDTCFNREPVHLDEVVAYCLSTYEPALEKGIERRFDLRLDPHLPPVQGDRARLVDVVMNLVGNAIKYSPKGGLVTIRAQPLDGRPEVLLCVADQGIGIPAEAMANLFEPFFRVRNEATEGIPGTGLGLAICRHIVDAHGGRIWVESEPGKGSVFCVALPSLSRHMRQSVERTAGTLQVDVG